jgi:ectoine hydroxylase-related dioxygenase (phytanoyl-CoA dioxygenase family)
LPKTAHQERYLVRPAAVADDRLPTHQDVDFFQEHGWWLSGRIIPDALLDAALPGIARYHAGDRDRILPQEAGYFDWTPEQGETLQQNGYISLQNEEVNALVRYPIVAASAARLLQVGTIRLFHDRLIVKPPDTPGNETALGWHTDRAYWRTCSSIAMLTAWIPFQDTTAEMGSLMVMDGSHRWPGNDWMATSHERELDVLEGAVSTAGCEVRKVTVEIKRGQVSFHHCLSIHGSGPNRSKIARVALAVHLQPGENCYQPAFSESGRPIGHMNDLLCGKDEFGNPNYADPDIFPQLWPVSGESRGAA